MKDSSIRDLKCKIESYLDALQFVKIINVNKIVELHHSSIYAQTDCLEILLWLGYKVESKCNSEKEWVTEVSQ